MDNSLKIMMCYFATGCLLLLRMYIRHKKTLIEELTKMQGFSPFNIMPIFLFIFVVGWFPLLITTLLQRKNK